MGFYFPDGNFVSQLVILLSRWKFHFRARGCISQLGVFISQEGKFMPSEGFLLSIKDVYSTAMDFYFSATDLAVYFARQA